MIFDQSFALSDIPRVFTLAFLELLLSADNAIVLGLISHGLAPHLRRKALYIGVLSAFFLRAAGLLGIAFILNYAWVQILGAAYLFYLSVRHFMKKAKAKKNPLLPTHVHSFWKTVILIELFDMAFAIDSIVAGVAFIGTFPNGSFYHPKLWIVYVGGMIGLLGTRYAADLFSHLLSRFPRLETSAYLMIGWIGIKLALSPLDDAIPAVQPVFWTGILLLFLLGFRQKK